MQFKKSWYLPKVYRQNLRSVRLVFFLIWSNLQNNNNEGAYVFIYWNMQCPSPNLNSSRMACVWIINSHLESLCFLSGDPMRNKWDQVNPPRGEKNHGKAQKGPHKTRQDPPNPPQVHFVLEGFGDWAYKLLTDEFPFLSKKTAEINWVVGEEVGCICTPGSLSQQVSPPPWLSLPKP